MVLRKNAFYNAVKWIYDNFSQYDPVIVGSSALYVLGIDDDLDSIRDLDILFLKVSQEEELELKRQTSQYTTSPNMFVIDSKLSHIRNKEYIKDIPEDEYIQTDFKGLNIKCATPECVVNWLEAINNYTNDYDPQKEIREKRIEKALNYNE